MANFAKSTLNAKKVAIFSDVKAPYSMGLAKYFQDPFVANGGEVVSEQKYTGGDKDFKAQLTAIKSRNPDAILVPGYYTEVGLIVAQARQLGITVPLFGGDGWEARSCCRSPAPRRWKALSTPRTFRPRTPIRWPRNSSPPSRRGTTGKPPMAWPRSATTRC